MELGLIDVDEGLTERRRKSTETTAELAEERLNGNEIKMLHCALTNDESWDY